MPIPTAPRARGARPLAVACALLVAAALPARAQSPTAPPPAGAAPAGAYTAEQAERGSALFGSRCAQCHTRSDMASPDFQLNWEGRSALELHERIRTTMPNDAPGTLPPAEYADVTAYILKLNGLPAGRAPLVADTTLGRVKLGAAGPPPAP